MKFTKQKLSKVKKEHNEIINYLSRQMLILKGLDEKELILPLACVVVDYSIQGKYINIIFESYYYIQNETQDFVFTFMVPFNIIQNKNKLTKWFKEILNNQKKYNEKHRVERFIEKMLLKEK